MQIPSTPYSGTTSSLSIASRSAAAQQQAVETRSPIMPAVQQPAEVEAFVNQQNPANRPTLVDEQVRLYGPFKATGATNAANVQSVNTDDADLDATPADVPAATDIAINGQARDQQSAQQNNGGERDAQSGAPGATDDAEAADIAGAARADGEHTAADARAEAQADASDAADRRAQAQEADKKADARSEAHTEQVEQQQVRELASRDREVRAHESAHASIGGQYAGAASFTMKRGPNGVSYASGGEVSIDVSAVPNDPEATIRKMQTVQRAALAPAQPSSADRAAAAQAAQVAQQARAEMQSSQAEARAAEVEAERTQRTEAAEKRSEISDRMAEIQNDFNFSDLFANAERSRQIDFIAEGYSPLRPSTIGTLLDTRA